MENRKKVILHKRNGWDNDRKLVLTDDQIKLLDWLSDENLIDNDDWDIQVLDDTDKWVAV